MSESLIRTEDLWKTYVMGSDEIHALRGVSVDSYVEDIKSCIKTILSKETDAFLKTMLDIKVRQRMQEEATMRSIGSTRPVQVKKWTQFLPLLYSLHDIRTPEPVSESMLAGFLRQLKQGQHAQHEQMDLLRSKIVQYSLFIQKMMHYLYTVVTQSCLLARLGS